MLIVGGRRWRDAGAVLYLLVEPGELLPKDVLDGFLAAVALSFDRQENQAGNATITAHRFVHPLQLDGEGAVVIVGLALDQQQRSLDLVGVQEG